jgi:hypothetical protein
MPVIKKKFETYNLFAAAELEEVYEEDKLENALHYEVYTFASAIFENTGSGQFKQINLPNEAQISTINDILLEDVDGDGLQDIIIAGNLFVSEIETPRSDAGVGLLLKNKGNMEFEAVSAEQSGILLPYDVKQLSWFKLGTYKIMLAAVNNGPLQLLKLNTVPTSSGR